jgi:NAD(P)-dependent dehydrogenase (short-subunit alcohol dehydrogenase family)
MKLEGQVAIVTGSGQGIGRATAKLFARQGAQVIINARTEETLETVSAEIKDLGGEACCVPGDVSKAAVVQKAVECAVSAFGKIDILVNNAGSGRASSGEYVNYERLEEKDWYYIMEQNLKSAHLGCQLVIPHMKKQGRGAIVNNSSVAGRTCEPGFSNEKLLAPIEATYVSAKAAMNGLTRQLARDLGRHGIRVNAVAPGVVLSSERLEKFWDAKPESERAKVTRFIPLSRPGRAQDVAHAILFLASEDAAYITGATLDVNGGLFMAP